MISLKVSLTIDKYSDAESSLQNEPNTTEDPGTYTDPVTGAPLRREVNTSRYFR